jgi:uncharacterized protein
MKQTLRTIMLAAAALFASLPAAAAPAEGGQLEVVQTGIPARPALWLVRDHDTTIYLFGTVHALPQGIDWLRGPVAAAFDGSAELVTEITEAKPEEMQAIVRSKATLPPGKTLRGMLSPAQRKAYQDALAAYAIPPATFDRFKPWFVAVNLAALPILRDGYASENGVEQLLDARAKAARRPHSALETAEFQLGLFDSLSQATQIRYLGEVAAELPNAKNDIDAMIEAWKQGDADTLARLMNEDEDEPELMQLLVINRNKTWADWIKTRLDKPGVIFLAVGAGHLAGAGSVQEQLAAKGIATARVQ